MSLFNRLVKDNKENMNFTKGLRNRETELQKIIKEKQKELTNIPTGRLKTCVHGNYYQYYRKNGDGAQTIEYIRKKDISVAMKLAQRDYDKKIYNLAQKELHLIEKLLHQYNNGDKAEDIYSKLAESRKPMVRPITDTDEEYIRKRREKK